MGKPGPKPRPLDERFWSKVKRGAPDECWMWGAAVMPNGYGRLNSRSGSYLAHRLAYTLTYGAIPDGLQIDHLCRNRTCVNPAHLEAVTPQINTRRSTAPAAFKARQTECIHGHAFTPKNTYVKKNGTRGCRACARIWQREFKARRKAQQGESA